MPVRIPSDQHETVVSVLREAARVNGDVEAYVEPDFGAGRHRLTFAEWDRAADGVAGHLARLGVNRGDVVCLLLPSSIDYAVLYGGLLRLGAITSGINPRMGAGEVASILDRAAPVLLVVDPEAGGRLDAGTTEVVTREETRNWWTEQGPDRVPPLASSDPVAVVWTSGTTGRPKGALFDHANLAAVARGTDVLSHPGDRRLSPVPFAHVGYMTRAWDEIGNAVTTIITPTPWRADEAIRVMADEGVTVAQGVPTQWALMLASDALPPADLSALRVAGTGAARMTADMVSEVRRRFGVPVVVRYTSTESSLGTGTTLTSTDDEVATTVGRPVAGVELAIVDDESNPVPAGTVGRVLLRSAAAMRGYWGRGPGRGRPLADLVDATATAAVLGPDGWLTTGDFGRLTPEGNLQLSGRAHERYIRGGYNVYPAEVEEALSSHPAIARAAVVGVPDDVLGEVGVAVVVAAAGEEPHLATLRAHCARELSDYKAPDALVLVDELPLTPMMKVDPVRLAALAARGAEERRLDLERSRRSDAGVLGNGPTGEEDEKERA
jgi:acyl-CoA synthetase (AMP-forming)/AMP-acid ligase II